jgi:hypothetical protein
MIRKINRNKELSIWEALIPVAALIVMLGFNVYVYGDEALSGSNQFVLLLGAAVAALVGFNKVSFDRMIEEVAENIKATVGYSDLAYGWCISRYLVSKRNYSIDDLLRFTNSKSGNILASHRDNMLYNFYRDRKFLDHKCYSWYRFDRSWCIGLIWEWLQVQ